MHNAQFQDVVFTMNFIEIANSAITIDFKCFSTVVNFNRISSLAFHGKVFSN